MARRIRAADIEEVKARSDLAEIIGQHVTLKSAGVGSLRGLCPFHDERTPSFYVRPQLGFYHCFGCGESGNVYTFLTRYEQLGFIEAVERLADRIGFQLQYEDGGAASDSNNRARMLAANRAAAEFFRARLAEPDAAVARQFLLDRGFDAAAATRFGLGYAPEIVVGTHRPPPRRRFHPDRTHRCRPGQRWYAHRL